MTLGVDLNSFDIIIVGAGLSGAVLAERYATEQNKRVLLLDSRDHIGGNCYDYVDSNGIRVSRYGAHLFHTNSQSIWDYVNRFTDWTTWEHRVLARVDDKLVPIPICIPTIRKLYGIDIRTSEEMTEWLRTVQVPIANPQNGRDHCLSLVGEDLYEKFFRHYTYKQWNRYPEELDASVLARIPLRDNWDDRYFTDRFQALPTHGYTDFFKNLLSNPNIVVLLETDYFDVQNEIRQFEKLFFTGPIDRYYAHIGLPKLEYRSIRFETRSLPTEYYQPNSVINFPDKDSAHVRIVEYKYFLDQSSDRTTIVVEYPSSDGDPYYPVPNSRNHRLYSEYQRLSKSEENVYFVGRLASYRYFNMDQAIENALNLYYELER